MHDGPPGDDDPLLAEIERMRAWLRNETNVAARSRVGVPDRRGTDRRALGFKARRYDDRDLNKRYRAAVSRYLARLTREQLFDFVDGLMIGNATDRQLTSPARIRSTDNSNSTAKAQRHEGHTKKNNQYGFLRAYSSCLRVFVVRVATGFLMCA